jgi:hypothetical protein
MSRATFQPTRFWLPAHALAMGFSLGHVILDWHAELFGLLVPVMRPSQALVLLSGASLYPLWMLALVLAERGSRVALLATFALCTKGGLGNGLSIVACLPPCRAAAPFADLTHIGSLVFGLWGMVESWRAATRPPRRFGLAGAPSRPSGEH